MELTLTDLKAYLASKEDWEVAGIPMAGSSCLIAEGIRWKYKLSHYISVNAENTYAAIHERTDWSNPETATVDKDVTEAASTFDNLEGLWMEDVSVGVLKNRMPELFR